MTGSTPSLAMRLRRSAAATLALTLALAAFSPLLLADELDEDEKEERGTLSFIWENDIYGGTDRNYSNGVKIGYLSRPLRAESGPSVVARTLLNAKDDDKVRYGAAIGHSIFTPEDRLATEPLPDQHPYAGWLYGEFAIVVERRSRILDTLTLQAGIVGPAAGGEWVQNNFHDLIDDDRLLGWDNQLENEPGFTLSFDRKFRAMAEMEFLGLGVDATPNIGVSVGNVLTQGTVGLTLRIGQDLRDDYGPPRVRPSMPGSAFFEPQRPLSWYFFAGAAGRAVAQNIFLDGNTFRDSLSVDKKPFVADFQAGAVTQIFNTQIAYTFVTRTEEFNGQGEKQQFGAISISTKW